MRSVLTLVILVLGFAAAADANDAPRRIPLRTSATVESARIRLADVTDAALPPDWGGLVVGAIEWPGASVEFSRARLLRILSASALGSVPILEGEAVTITRSGRTITPARLEAAVRASFESLPLPVGVEAQRLTITNIPRVSLVDGPLTVRITGDGPEIGAGQIPVDLIDVQGTHRRVHVPVVRALRVKALRAAHDLTRGERISALNTLAAAVWVDSRGLWNQILRPGADAGGVRTVRDVPNGTFLQQRDLREIPHVERGSVVQWTVRRGGVEVVSEVEARGQGRIGDWIQVKSPFGGRLHRVRITGPGAVGDPPVDVAHLAPYAETNP